MLELIQYLIAQHSQEVAQLFSMYGFTKPVTPDALLLFLQQNPQAEKDLAKILAQENGYEDFASTDDFWGFFVNMFKRKKNQPRRNNQSNGIHRKNTAAPRSNYEGGAYEEFDAFDYSNGKNKPPKTYTTAMPSFDIGNRRRSSSDIQATRKSVDASKLESDKVASDTAKSVAASNADTAKPAADGTLPKQKTDFKQYIPYIIVACAVVGLAVTLWKIFKK